ncbi:hypothetical protein K0038_02557 [Pseudomonas syringae]|uniref:hypothetical protein n=1 Tax=Pseudomonas syringae TaxID=317 RepID=UPI001CA98530|nr:hypothetical protein [Pseudomonas syringae]MCI3945515.1 hypothetical protein [Pseudomonas syringae]
MQEDSENVTSDEFIEFLTEKCPDGKCAACGDESYKLLSSPEVGAWIFESEVVNEEGFHLQTYAVNCSNCGWVRHHVAWRVREWVKKWKSTESTVDPKEEKDD